MVFEIPTFRCLVRNNQSPPLEATSQSSLIFLPSSIKACLCSGSIFPFMDLLGWWTLQTQEPPRTCAQTAPLLDTSTIHRVAGLGMFVPLLCQLPGGKSGPWKPWSNCAAKSRSLEVPPLLRVFKLIKWWLRHPSRPISSFGRWRGKDTPWHTRLGQENDPNIQNHQPIPGVISEIRCVGSLRPNVAGIDRYWYWL